MTRKQSEQLLAAVFYATAIITTGFFSKKYDPLLLGIVQVSTMGQRQ